jgi:hypothetical protein
MHETNYTLVDPTEPKQEQNPSQLTGFVDAEEGRLESSTAVTTAPQQNNNWLANWCNDRMYDLSLLCSRLRRWLTPMNALYLLAAILSLLGAVQQLFAAIRFGLALQLPEQMDGVKDGDIHTWWPVLEACVDGTCIVPITMGVSSYIANVILGVMFFPNTLIAIYKSFTLLAILTAHLPQMLCSYEQEQLPANLLEYTPLVAYPFPKHYEHLKPPTLAFAAFDILSLLTSWTTIPIYVVLSLEAITDMVKNIGWAAYVFVAATVIVNWCSRYVGSKEMFRKIFNFLPFLQDWVTSISTETYNLAIRILPDSLVNSMATTITTMATSLLWHRSKMDKNALQNLSYLAKHIRRNQFELSEEERQEIANLTEPSEAIENFLQLTNDKGKPINFSYTQQEFLEEIGPSLVACMSLIVYFDIAKDGAKDLNFPDNILLQGYIALPNFLYYLMMFPLTALSAYVGYDVLKNEFGPCAAKFFIAALGISALFAGGNMADKFLEFVADGHADWLNPENSSVAEYALFFSLTIAGLLCSAFPNFIAYITVVQYCYDAQRGDFVELLNDIETELTKGVADPTYDGYANYAAIVGMWRTSGERHSVNGEYTLDELEAPTLPLLQNS